MKRPESEKGDSFITHQTHLCTKTELEATLARAEELQVSLHPNLAEYYREQIGRLREAFQDEAMNERTTEAIRALIERIELEPLTLEGQEIVAVKLRGKLASIFTLATNAKRPLDDSDLCALFSALRLSAFHRPTTSHARR